MKEVKRKRETKYGKRLKKRKHLAGKLGSAGYFIVVGGRNAGRRMPQPMSILIALAREKGGII